MDCVRWPTIFIAAERGTPARLRLRTALIEGVKEFFLRALLHGQELDIIARKRSIVRWRWRNSHVSSERMAPINSLAARSPLE